MNNTFWIGIFPGIDDLRLDFIVRIRRVFRCKFLTNPKNILITGGTGYFGSHLAKRLQNEHNLVILKENHRI